MAVTQTSPARLIRKLYGKQDHGYDLNRGEAKKVRQSRSCATYGEIMPAATQHLLDYLQPGPRDVLMDLGSGAGKFIIQAAMTVKAKKMLGVELADSRCQIAREHLALAKTQKLLLTRNVDFVCGDILKTDIANATIIYTCSTAFPLRFMQHLTRHLASGKKGLRVASLQELPDNPWFDKVEHLFLDMSWRRKTKVHIYILSKPLGTLT